MPASSPDNAVTRQFPSELTAAIQLEAERDAERVAQFLQELAAGLGLPGATALPAGCLLELGAALRLAEWEQCGIVPTTSPTLPTATESIRSAFLDTANHGSLAPPIASQVMRAFVENFAWTAREELGVTMRLDTVDDDFAAKLAAFVWKYRHLIEEATV